MTYGLISISDLKIHCIVGIYPHERLEPQDLFIDLELKIDLTAIEQSEQLDDTVDYATLSEQLSQLIQERRFELIENLALSSCSFILQHWTKIEWCKIKVKKPAAIPNSKYAAITIEQHRSALFP
jgi:7,8-dihydroneopterin aldolase/epimerase/oxygenase